MNKIDKILPKLDKESEDSFKSPNVSKKFTKDFISYLMKKNNITKESLNIIIDELNNDNS